jgi:serine/threonine protein kinase
MRYEENWEIIGRAKSGGQGSVYKVRNKNDGRYGALKIINQQSMGISERRSRFAREIFTLKTLKHASIPCLLESNEQAVDDKNVPLYMVSTWVDGTTLAQYRMENEIDYVMAEKITLRLLPVLKYLSENDVVHRDIKPDNIMVNIKNPDDVTLSVVDFGISWMQDDSGFETETQQGLGNRFLELPELKPGRNIRDSRSDVTYAVGILFFLIFNRFPRVLIDENGRMPHQSISKDEFSRHIPGPDIERLNNIFDIGFQNRIDSRFSSADELLAKLLPKRDVPMDLDDKKRKLLEKYSADDFTKREENQKYILELSRYFISEISKHLGSVRLIVGGSGPNIDTDGITANCGFYAVRSGTSHPQARFQFLCRFSEGRVLFLWGVGSREVMEKYNGSIADKEGNRKTVEQHAAQASEMIISDYTDML